MKQRPPLLQAPWFPYVAPFVAFLILTYIGASHRAQAHLWYAAKTAVVGGMLLLYRRSYPELRWNGSVASWGIGIAAGLLALVIWVAPERLLEPLRIGAARGFDPYALVASGNLRTGVIAVRLLGASVVVPVMEELFWRSFAMRAVIHPDFRRVALGTFRAGSFILVAVAFGFEHDRWIVGILAGGIYGGLLVWRRDLFTCVLAHGVTNLGLGIYVLATRQWTFW